MSKSERTIAIVNPNSANGRTGKRWPELEAQIVERTGECHAVLCAYRGHGTELTREALRTGLKRVISVGGDGTHNEVINGFFAVDGARINPRASLAILPQGTASDFARTLGVETVEDGLDLLERGNLTAVDVGRVTLTSGRKNNVRHFLNVAHFGVGGLVAQKANETTKAVGGATPYVLASLKTLYRLPKYRMHLRIDEDEISMDCINVIVANGRYFGGGVMVTPKARLDNGVFEVFLVGAMSRTEAIANLSLLYSGRIAEMDQVLHLKAKRIELHATKRVPISLDGEQPGHLPACVELLRGAIRLHTRKYSRRRPQVA